MAEELLPPPPKELQESKQLYRWYQLLYRKLTDTNALLWASVSKAESALEDLEERAHSSLQDVNPVDDTDTDTTFDKHLANSKAKEWTDGIAATVAGTVQNAADIAVNAAAIEAADGQLIGVNDGAEEGTAGVVLQMAAITDLAQTITNPPTQTEVQDLSTKVDELLAALRTAGMLNT